MKPNRFLHIFLLCMLSIWPELLHAQSLQVALSPTPNVNRTISGGTAKIFFDSSIEELSIICTDENPEEPIVKVGENLWCMYINAEKDIEEDGFSYRNFLIYSPSSIECTITTPTIKPNQILYYSIRPKLEVKLSNDHNKVDRQAGNGKATIIFDCKMKDLSIVCVDGEIEETVNKSSDRLRFVHIDVCKDLKVKSSCSRTFIAKRGDMSIFLINTGFINPNQVLYYTVMKSNKIEAKLLDVSVTD